jgi:hypothetical protein
VSNLFSELRFESLRFKSYSDLFKCTGSLKISLEPLRTSPKLSNVFSYSDWISEPDFYSDLTSDDREDSNIDSRHESRQSRQSDKDKELLALSFNKENKLFTYLDTDFTNDDLEKSERSQRENSRESKSRERNNSSKGSSLDHRYQSSEHEINPSAQINTIDV